MSRRLVRLFLVWNIVLTILLLVSLAGNAAWVQASNDPPVRVYSATSNDVGGGGAQATADDSITSTGPDTLVSVTTGNLSELHQHVCVVTASANAKYKQTSGNYIFDLSVDGISIPASERRIEMFNNAGINDDSYEEVSTTFAFTTVGGSHTFSFRARKSAAGNGDLTVDTSSMTIVCVKKYLTAQSSQNGSDD